MTTERPRNLLLESERMARSGLGYEDVFERLRHDHAVTLEGVRRWFFSFHRTASATASPSRIPA